jgi:hypothetical protein
MALRRQFRLTEWFSLRHEANLFNTLTAPFKKLSSPVQIEQTTADHQSYDAVAYLRPPPDARSGD